MCQEIIKQLIFLDFSVRLLEVPAFLMETW